MRINIIGAGLAGLSAAITLAENGVKSNLISSMQSERAQSVMAEGGINACLNTMGEDDKIEYHYEDTMRGGVDLADTCAAALISPIKNRCAVFAKTRRKS
nr:FAD-binding protein [uncultured Ruminococcus sp.]